MTKDRFDYLCSLSPKIFFRIATDEEIDFVLEHADDEDISFTKE